MVPKLEPEYQNREGWERHLIQGVKRVLFFDNNWLAKDVADLAHDVEIIKGLVSGGQIKSVDFKTRDWMPGS